MKIKVTLQSVFFFLIYKKKIIQFYGQAERGWVNIGGIWWLIFFGQECRNTFGV